MRGPKGKLALAVTGASGAIYGLRMAQWLSGQGYPFYFTVSSQGKIILKEETGIDLREGNEEAALRRAIKDHRRRLSYLDVNDLSAPISSGSSRCPALVVIPCSMGTLGRIACGISSNLIERAADVMLKEGRRLVLVPRETPLNAIHLENMLRLSRAGACIIPAMPAFYHSPARVEDLIDFVVGKVLDALSIDHTLFRRWKSGPA